MMELSSTGIPRKRVRFARTISLALLAVTGTFVNAQTGTIQIGSGPNTSQYSPLYTCYGYNYSQQIYLASELTSASAVAGDLTAIRFFHVNGADDASTWNHWTVYIGGTSQSSFTGSSNWVPYSDLQQVYSGTVTPTTGSWMELQFDSPFTWDGVENLVVAVYEDVPSYSCTANWKSFTTTTNRLLLFYNDNTNPDPTNPPAANYGPNNSLAQVQFVGALASCLPPADITLGALTATNGEFTWTDNASEGYDYEVRTSGAPGSGPTGLFASGNVTSGTPAIPLVDMTPNTSYFIYVSSICDGANSQWSLPLQFKTPCAPVDIPYMEDFNSVSLYDVPTCFTSEPIAGQPWGTTDYPITGMTGNSAYVYYDYESGPDVWLHTDGLNLEGGVAYRLSYKYGNGYLFSQSNLYVYAESGPAAADTIVQLAAHENISTDVALSNSVDFTAPSTGVYYFGFRYYAEAFTYPDNMYLDDIKVVLVPSCEEVTNLNGSTSSDTEGLISWTASVSNPANGYDLYYSTDPTAPDGATIPDYTGITGTSQALSGLTTGQPVYAWVRSVCSDSDNSLWTGPVSFVPGTFQIGTGEGSNNYLPIYSCYGYNYSQQIYLASEYLGGTLITNIAFKYLGNGTNLSSWQDWTIYLGSTSQSSFSGPDDWVPFAALNEAWTGTITPIAGEWMNITLTTPYAWDGLSNIVVAVDENTPGYSCTANWASFNAGANRGMLYYNDNNNPDPASPPSANYGPTSTIAQMQLSGVVPVDCDALPNPGATTGPVSVCPNTNFILSTENTNFANGISRQWEVSLDGVNWTNAPGSSTLANYQASQTEDTWYRVQVTCDIAGTTASTPIQVLTNPPTECYCTSIDFQYTVEPICNVTFAGIDNTSSGSINGSPAYEDFTNTPAANVVSGFDFPISVTGNPNGSFSQPQVVAFFDWDQDGIFESSQNIGIISGASCANPITATITVPTSALPGTSRMRVIKSAYNTPNNPCAVYDYGQAEDYLINVFAPTPCTDLPAPGATTGPAAVCPQKPFSVTISNVVLATGLTYQWEKSSDGTTWVNATGNSTSPSYSTSITDTTWFRVQATCDMAGTTASTPLEVTLSPPTECYCPPTLFSGQVNPICNVTFADLDHSSDGSIDGSPAYEDFSEFTATVQRGHTYTLSASGTVQSFFGETGYIDAYFDWNGDGTFESLIYIGTFVGGSVECDSTVSYQLTVPMSAAYGTTRMRVILSQNSYAGNPCEDQDLYSGQVEEYTINVLNDVGVADLSGANGIAVYPNPASTVLHISTPEGRPVNVKVLDITGNLVMDRARVRDLDISKLAAGSYVLVATEQDGTHAVHARFVKQ